MTRLLVIDTETGGTDPQLHSILSLGAIVWCDGAIGGEFEVFVAEPTIATTPKALEINGIDIEELRRSGLAPTIAMDRFREFLWEHLAPEMTSKDKVTLVGHNVGFDVGFLRRFCGLAGVRYDDLFSHRTLDTASIVRFLSLAGLLPLTGASSSEAFEYFGIHVPQGKRHTALGDAHATATLLTKLIETTRSGKKRRAAA